MTKSLKAFLKQNIFIVLAFLLPAFIMAVCFALHSYAPFGNRMIMTSDAWHQYFPFLSEYQHLLKSGALPLYSWNTGGGSNFLGVVGNYVASPFYLFTYFLPESTLVLEV